MAVATNQPTEADSQFRVEATGTFHEPRTRILKHGDTFAVLSPFGDMVGDAEPASAGFRRHRKE